MSLLFRYLKAAVTRNEIFHLTFFVTGLCNLRCKMCFYLDNIEKARKKDELTLDEIRKISEKLKPFIWLLISGGEPFLRDDIFDICKTFYQNNNVKNITIPTNGLETEKIIEITDKLERVDNINELTKILY